MLRPEPSHTLPHALDAAFSKLDFQTCRRIAVAVSGGSDSLSALFGLKAYLSLYGLNTHIMALTVDHGLRPESAHEAQHVAALCLQHDIVHQTLVWRGEKPVHGVQRQAREARYRLLAEAAQQAGADCIITGHTLDDSLETVAMRAERGEGRGLAGIAPATLYDRRIWFVRPLLALRKVQLRAWLAQENIGWIDDPSNTNTEFERVRVRQDLAVTEHDTQSLKQAASDRAQESRLAAQIMSDPNRVLSVQHDGMAASIAPHMMDNEAAKTALAALLSLVGLKEHWPSQGALAKAAGFVARSENGDGFTVHGCRLQKRGGVIVIERETRNCGAGRFGYDFLLPSFDLPLAQAIRKRRNLPKMPESMLINESS